MVEQRTHKPLVAGSNPAAATKMKEIEARFLEIDPSEIEKKLKKLGAKKVFDRVFKEAIFQPPKGKGFEEWEKTRKRVRLRDTGEKVILALKENEKWALSETKEIEIEVSDFDKASELLSELGLELKRTQEKRRIRYDWEGIYAEIDFWPWIPPALEIEADEEDKVKKLASLLELDWEKAEFRDAKKVYWAVYGIDIDKFKEIAFNKPKPKQ